MLHRVRQRLILQFRHRIGPPRRDPGQTPGSPRLAATSALWSMALVGSTSIGSPVIGALSEVASPRYTLGLGAAACLAVVIIGGRSGRGIQ
jgi:hypothetical protein